MCVFSLAEWRSYKGRDGGLYSLRGRRRSSWGWGCCSCFHFALFFIQSPLGTQRTSVFKAEKKSVWNEKNNLFVKKTLFFITLKSGGKGIHFVIYLDSMCAAKLVMSEEQQEKWKGMFGRLRNCRKNTKRWVLFLYENFHHLGKWTGGWKCARCFKKGLNCLNSLLMKHFVALQQVSVFIIRTKERKMSAKTN